MKPKVINPKDGPVVLNEVGPRTWEVFFEVNMNCRYNVNGEFPHWSGAEGFPRAGNTTIVYRLPEGWKMEYQLPGQAWKYLVG